MLESSVYMHVDLIFLERNILTFPRLTHVCTDAISSVYDPLGAVLPVILVGKQQSLCRQNVKWDDPAIEDILPLCEKWWTELPLLERLTFPCCFKPLGFGDRVCTKIHNFSDTSDNDISQISYLLMISRKNKVHVSFLMAKSRVAPLKPISIHRLELTAVVVSVKRSLNAQEWTWHWEHILLLLHGLWDCNGIHQQWCALFPCPRW